MLKANFPVRVVGKVGSVEDARVAAGISGTGAEKLLGRGDFVIVAAGNTIRFQAAWVPTQDWAQMAAGL
jgi:S-DNA-T family DNA segregation ATPase FtsK/SpoIIIE